MNQELFGITPPKQLFIKLEIPSLVIMLFSSIYIISSGASFKIGIKLGEKRNKRQLVSFQLLFY